MGTQARNDSHPNNIPMALQPRRWHLDWMGFKRYEEMKRVHTEKNIGISSDAFIIVAVMVFLFAIIALLI
jgi:hypothetical protein